MELIKLSGLNSCNLNHVRFSSIFSPFSHGKTFNSQVLVFPAYLGAGLGILPEPTGAKVGFVVIKGQPG